MKTYPFDLVVELSPNQTHYARVLTVIPEGRRWVHGSLHFEVLRLWGDGSAFIEVTLQVGDGETWAPWISITDIVKKGDSRHGELYQPCHPRFRQLRIRVGKQVQTHVRVGLELRIRGFAAYDLVEKPEPPEKPPEAPEPPEGPRPPERPSQPFDLGRWLEYGLRKMLRDEEPPSCNPTNTKLLVSLLAAIYAATLVSFDKWAAVLGLTPIPTLLVAEPWRLFTHMWLHAPIVEAVNGLVVPHAHIAMNVLFLWVFGDNVECRLGHGKYLAYYLICGVIAGLGEVLWLHIIGLGLQPIIIVGASGAISGIMGLYFTLFPRNHVIFFGKRMTAWTFLALWFIGQIALLFQIGVAVAVAAHVTGFLTGIVFGEAEKYAERELSQ